MVAIATNKDVDDVRMNVPMAQFWQYVAFYYQGIHNPPVRCRKVHRNIDSDFMRFSNEDGH